MTIDTGVNLQALRDVDVPGLVGELMVKFSQQIGEHL
jgi:hypothetical protein